MKDQGKDREQSPDKLDQLLDESLAQYSQTEPLAGLEDRILARLAQTPEEPVPWYTAWFTSPRLAWVLTAAALVVGISVGMYMVTRPGEDVDYVGGNTTIQVKGEAPLETADLPPRIPKEVLQQRAPRVTLTTEEPVIKAEVFPAPAPLSEEERLAMTYARMSPGMKVIPAAEPGIKELEVKPLEMAPLKVEITGGSGG